MDHRGTVGRIKKTNTIYCYKQNMKALGLVVSEKKIFLCFTHDPPPSRGSARMDPRGTVGRIYKEDHYTLLLTKYESSGPCGFGEEYFFMFSHCKSMGANDPRGGAIFDPRGMIGRIYIEDTKHCYTQNMKALGLVVSEKKIFFIFSSLRPRGGARMDPRGTVGRIYEEDH